MILNYNELENKKLIKYKKKGLDIKIFTPQDFKEYKKEVEDNGGNVTVIRNTKLKKYKEKENEQDNDEYIEIQGKKFKLKKEKSCSTKGYIPVGNDRFVRIESNFLFFIILIILICGLFLGTSILSDKKPGIPNPDIEMDDTKDWDGDNPTHNSKSDQENTIIPGYADITATKDAGLIKLYNPEQNTVNFIYTITKKVETVKVETFKTVDEAQQYITNNSIQYTNYYDEKNNKYVLKDQDGNLTEDLIEYKAAKDSDETYTVNKITSKVIYFSKGIAPNTYVDWNAYEFLGIGNHEVQFRISTYDIETNSTCYGAVQDLTINVE